MSTPSPSQDAQDLAGIEARYADVLAAYSNFGTIETVTPEMLVPYNACLKEYHRYIMEISAFNQRLIDGHRLTQRDLEARVDEIFTGKMAPMLEQVRLVRNSQAAEEAARIMRAANPEIFCPTCGIPYDDDDDGGDDDGDDAGDMRDW